MVSLQDLISINISIRRWGCWQNELRNIKGESIKGKKMK